MDKGKGIAYDSNTSAQSEKIKIEEMIEKTRQVLPDEIFLSTKAIIIDHTKIISKILFRKQRRCHCNLQ